MEDILDSIAQTTPVDLRDLVEVKPLSSLPDSTIKHNAATVAMLSDAPLQSYQAIVSEQGQGVSYTKDEILRKKIQRVEPEMKQGLMSLLSDPAVPLATKEKAIKGMVAEHHKEPMVLMANDNYAAPVKGESPEQEVVRISGAELFGGYRELAQERNKILNSRKLEASQESVGDFLLQLVPFSTNVEYTRLLDKVGKELKLGNSKLGSFVLPGSAMAAMSEAIQNIPPQQQIEVLQNISRIIKDNPLVFEGNNTLSALANADALIGGNYSTFNKIVDNTVGILDAIGLGSLAKSTGRAITKLFTRTPNAEQAKITQKAITESPSPVSVIKVQGETNPDKARASYAVIVKSEGDEVAQALAGTTKTAAVADAHIPQALSLDGSITAKVQKPDAILHQIDPEADIVNAWRDALGKGFTEEEAALATVNTLDKLKDVTGITVLDNLVSVGERDGKVVISAVFGGDKGGMSSAEQVLVQAQMSLRQFGVKETDLILMKKVDGEYVPITLAEAAGKEGDYVVKLDMEKGVEASDVGKLTAFDVKRNWFDRVMSLRSEKQGTVANHILDHASMLHKELTAKAVVQADKASSVEKVLLQKFEGFSTLYGKLDKNQQALAFDVIQEANKLGVEFTASQLRYKGLGGEAIQAIDNWRKAWDQMYWLENGIKGKQLSHQGYQVFDNGVDKYFVRPISKNQNITKAYDSVTDTIVTLSKADQDALYNAGGTLSKFVRPHAVNGTLVEHMIVHNSPTHYSRAIRDSDQVLDYRAGYYQVQYTAPKFIVHTDSNGVTRAVAVAGDTGEANQVAARYATANGLSKDSVSVRSDLKDLQSIADFTWDLDVAAGRIAQRRRGKRLEGADQNITVAFEKTHILDPVESATRASMSLANRVAMGDFLEASKARAMQQYGQYMKTVDGFTVWPSSSNMLKGTSTGSASHLADARTTVEYLNYLTRGYENALDNGARGLLKAMSDMAGEKGLYAVERGLETASHIKPTQAAKSAVFGLMISAAPLRQWVVQTHGVVRLAAYGPEATIRAFPEINAYIAKKVFGVQSKLADEMDVFISRSGLLDSIDKHNLIRGAVHDISLANKPVVKGMQKAIEIPRKAGFDRAEQTNALVHAAVVRQKYKLAGKDVTNPRVMDEIHAEAKAIMGDMNFAGDMPYNQNWAGLFMQFLQYPHKMITSVTTNRRLDAATKIKLAAVDAALFGIPGYALLERFAPEDALPQDEKWRTIFQSGLEDWYFNKLMSEAAGTKVNIDFSSLSPYEADGFKKFGDAMATTGFGGLMKMAPIMSIVGPNGKLPEAANRMLRYMGLKETYDGMPVEDYVSVFQGVAEMASGWSAGKRAYLAYEAGKLRDKDGMPVVENYTAYHAILGALGFRSKEELIGFKVSQEAYEANKSVDEDIKQTVREHIRILSRDQQAGVYDPEKVGVLLNMFNKMYADNPKALEKANKFISQELANSKDRMLQGIVESSLNPSVYERLHEVRKLHQLDDADTNKALNLAKQLDAEIRAQQKENK